jgi:Transposase DDE domain
LADATPPRPRASSRPDRTPPRQAYSAQTAVNDKQIILAAEITVDAPDFGHLEPMLDRTLGLLERHGVTERPGAVIADAGYWHTAQIQTISEQGIEVLVPPDGNMREGLRADQIQPAHRPVHATRQSRRTVGMAVSAHDLFTGVERGRIV